MILYLSLNSDNGFSASRSFQTASSPLRIPDRKRSSPVIVIRRSRTYESLLTVSNFKLLFRALRILRIRGGLIPDFYDSSGTLIPSISIRPLNDSATLASTRNKPSSTGDSKNVLTGHIYTSAQNSPCLGLLGVQFQGFCRVRGFCP